MLYNCDKLQIKDRLSGHSSIMTRWQERDGLVLPFIGASDRFRQSLERAGLLWQLSFRQVPVYEDSGRTNAAEKNPLLRQWQFLSGTKNEAPKKQAHETDLWLNRRKLILLGAYFITNTRIDHILVVPYGALWNNGRLDCRCKALRHCEKRNCNVFRSFWLDRYRHK